jgi:glyoxylate carboligase
LRDPHKFFGDAAKRHPTQPAASRRSHHDQVHFVTTRVALETSRYRFMDIVYFQQFGLARYACELLSNLVFRIRHDQAASGC